jgi:hypothetical protein
MRRIPVGEIERLNTRGEEPVIGCPAGVKRELSSKQGWVPPVLAILVLCFGFLWYLASSSAELPDRVATHFQAARSGPSLLLRSGCAPLGFSTRWWIAAYLSQSAVTGFI